MTTNKVLLSVAVFGAFATASVASSASAATIVNVGTFPPANPFFFLTSGTPTSPSITTNFGATITGSLTPFDDIFEFTVPQDGRGSGSISTSFSSLANKLTITDILLNGVSQTVTTFPGGQSLAVTGVPIHNGVLNTVEVKGVTTSVTTAATFAGTASFAAGGIPEPASWALMIGGLGLAGAAMRYRRNTLRLA